MGKNNSKPQRQTVPAESPVVATLLTENCLTIGSKKKKHIIKGKELNCHYWVPLDKPKGLMIVVPGYRECLQKYEELAIKFYEEGFLVFGHDYEKGDGFVSIERWVTEVKHHIHEMKDYYRNTFKKDNSPPLFAVGSSLGGMILLSALEHQEEQSKINYLVLMSPLINVFENNIKDFVVKLLTSDGDKQHEISHDPEIYKEKMPDALVAAIKNRSEDMARHFSSIDVPFQVLHAQNDQLSLIGGSNSLFQGATNVEREINIFDYEGKIMTRRQQKNSNDLTETLEGFAEGGQQHFLYQEKNTTRRKIEELMLAWVNIQIKTEKGLEILDISPTAAHPS